METMALTADRANSTNSTKSTGSTNISKDCVGSYFFQYIITDCLVGCVPFFIITLKYLISKHAPKHAGKVVRICRGKLLDWLGRFNEQRGRRVFILDVGKQVGAQAMLHVLNYVFTQGLSSWVPNSEASSCEVYWFSLVLDTTLGTAIMALLLKAIVRQHWYKHYFGFDFGDYRGEGHRISYRIFLKQLGIWLVLVFIMRFLMFLVTVLAYPCGLVGLSRTFLSFIEQIYDNPNAELFIVKFVTPIVFNTFQVVCYDELIQTPGEIENNTTMLTAGDEYTEATMSTTTSTEKRLARKKTHIKDLSKQFAGFTAKDLDAIWILEREVLGEGEEDEKQELTTDQKQAITDHVEYLVEIFRQLDIGEENVVTAGYFKKACTNNSYIAKLFEVRDMPGKNAKKKDQILVNHFRKQVKKRGPATFEDIVKFFHGKSKAELDEKFTFDNSGGEVDTNDERDEQEPGTSEADIVLGLPKWGDHPLPKELYDQEVARYHCRYKAEHEAEHERNQISETGDSPPLTTVTSLTPMLSNRRSSGSSIECFSVPPQQDVVGPAVPCVFLAVANNFAAFAFMPVIALGTMDCKPFGEGNFGGFADHPIWGLLLDVVFLGVFVYIAKQLQDEIVRHTLIGQLATLGNFEFPGIPELHKIISCWQWYHIMQVITFLNLMTVWTNAEVLGRVLATFNNCEKARDEISNRWAAAVNGSFFAEVVPDGSDIVFLSTVMYLPIFLQPVFAILYATTTDPEVGYKVGNEPDQKHDNYWTVWQQMEGAQVDHNAVVQVLSALVSYEAVTFADYHRNRFLMDYNQKRAEQEFAKVQEYGSCIQNLKDEELLHRHCLMLAEDDEPVRAFRSFKANATIASSKSSPAVAAPDVVTTQSTSRTSIRTSHRSTLDATREAYAKHEQHCESLAQAVNGYYKAMQQEIQKILVSKLVLVGLLQNALQTKVQITMFSLNYSLTEQIDFLFLFGVVCNLAAYAFSIIEFWDFFALLYSYFSDHQQKMAGMLQNEHVVLKYKQYEIRRVRKKRINIAYWFGVVFILIYTVLWIYLSINFIMVFVCPKHVWNISYPLMSGCLEVDHSSGVSDAINTDMTWANNALPPPQWLLP